MTPSAPDAPRQPPRFVPTLTEVVVPELAAEPVAQAQLPLPVDQLAEPLTQRVLERLRPTLDREVSEVVAKVVHAQMEGLAQRVQLAVETLVREAVMKALAQELVRSSAPAGDGSPPP